MRINSKFKDYYDYIGHKFGQDPDVVYNRGSIPKAEEYDFDYKPRSITGQTLYHMLEKHFRKDVRTSDPNLEVELEIVCVGSLVLPQLAKNRFQEEWDPHAKRKVRVLAETKYEMVGPEAFQKFLYQGNWRPKWADFEADMAFLRRKLPGIQRDLEAPVFVIGWWYKGVRVLTSSPRLANYDIPAYVPAEVAWQEIYACITNVLRKNPDKEPPVKISNQDKIVKAGFDLKTSFRNPINPKPKKR